jgi:outer membrane protein assembly factor BamB
LGTPRHDLSATESLSADPRPEWKADVGRAVRGGPALGDSIIAVGVAERVVVLLDRATGEPIWRKRVGGTVHGGPLLQGDRLYIATERAPEGHVYALRLRDGERIWSYPTGSVVAPLAIDAEGVYGGTENGGAFRLDPEKGRLLWRAQLSGGVRAGPVPTPHGIVYATTRDTLYLLDRVTGTVRRKIATPGTVLATPALGDGRLFLGTVEGRVLEVSIPEFLVQWNEPAGDGVYGAPALIGDTLYVLARNGHLSIIPVDAPHTTRVHDLDVVTVAGPTPTGSGVLIATVSGEILLVDPASGGILWRAQVDGPVEQPPLVLDQQLVVVGGRGDIHTYR